MKVTIKDTAFGNGRFSIWKIIGDTSELLKGEDGPLRFQTYEEANEYCVNHQYEVI